MRAHFCWLIVAACGVTLAATPVRDATHAATSHRALPAIVFVSRIPPTGPDAGQIPGLGPHGTFAGNGGRLLERDPAGKVRELVPARRFFDVADPAPSPDARRVAFAARETPHGAWRIWIVNRAGGPPTCSTCDHTSGDDADPAWWGDALLFVSTRAGGKSLYDETPLTQLWALLADGRTRQLTFEQNGVLDPVAERLGRRLLFSRWWFNPWSPDSARGVARAASRTGDSVNVWQVVSAELTWDQLGLPRLEDVRLAAGGRTPRRRSMGIQPAPLGARGVVAVAARNTGLAPRPGALAIQRFGAPPSAGERIAGAAIGDDAGDPYTENANLLAPGAVAPAVLPDGRIVHALDPGGRGAWGLVITSADGKANERLLDLPGTWELDPAPVPEGVGHVSLARHAQSSGRASPATFRYLASDVFAGRGAAPRQLGARLHVYRVVSGDSVEYLRRIDVPRNGRVDVQLPADVPLFELLTDSHSRVLMSAHGATQVRGFNSGSPGSTARCSGCHLGHSAGR
jgi:hypothetical protein